MAAPRTDTGSAGLQLEKLGIREIRERIEVVPILVDPGDTGLDGDEPTPKSYVCTINLSRPVSKDPLDIS